MYDAILKSELSNLNKANNIDSLNFNRKEMIKIIKCRTKDKIDFINFLLLYNAIDYDCYKELLERIQSDYKKANLYLLGLCNI